MKLIVHEVFCIALDLYPRLGSSKFSGEIMSNCYGRKQISGNIFILSKRTFVRDSIHIALDFQYQIIHWNFVGEETVKVSQKSWS